MKKSKIFFALLITIVLMMVLASCSEGKSLGSILDDIFSNQSDRDLPAAEPTAETTPAILNTSSANTTLESTPAVLFENPNKIEFEQTLTVFYENINENPLDQILNDFYTYHNERGFGAVEELLITEPDNAMALALRGAFKMRREEWDAGFEDSNMALEIDPNLSFAHVNHAWYYQYHLLDRETAQKEINIALELDPNLAYAHCIMAGLHNTMNDIQPIIDSYKKAIDLRPDYYVAYCNLGVITTPLEDDINGSMTYFDKAIALCPEEGRAYFERGYIFSIFGTDSESVIADLSQAIDLGYKPPNSYEFRSGAYIRIGAYANALTDLEHVIKLDPDRTNAHNLAAILIAYTDGDLEKALAYNEKTLELLPDEERYWDTRAYIYYKMGKIDEAFQIFNDLIESDYRYAYYGRGLIYYSLGDKENAISDFLAYLSTQSGDFRTGEVKRLLKEMGVKAD